MTSNFEQAFAQSVERALDEAERHEAERFAAALDELEAGRDPGVDPAEDPAFYADLQAVSRLHATAEHIEPRPGYRTRSRALVVDAAALRARRLERRRPVFNRTSFLVPFASAAAAAGLTIGAVLLASAAGYGPGGRGGTEAVRQGPAQAPETAAATNLTQRSIEADLRTLQASLDAVLAAAARGEELDPEMLRSITEHTLAVTSLIESSPEQVKIEEVIAYYQTAAEARIKLGEVAPLASATPATTALETAQRASEDGVLVAAQHVRAYEERLASGQGLH